jgi:hypothetical protein
MGMFDWYEPSDELTCPECQIALKVWQGKDGPCGLFVWREGHAQAVDQRVDSDVKLDPSARASWRLPERFEIYSYDCGRHRVEATGTCEEGTWVATQVEHVAHVRAIQPPRR